MRNKIIIFFLLFYNFLIYQAYSNDQISFDVSEIEILDGGNKIIGKNRGTISIDDGIIIEADNFEFDKIKNILKAQGNIKIQDQINNYNFSAQNILYDKDKERIEIKGKSEALIDSNYKFKTENVLILREDQVISSDLVQRSLIILIKHDMKLENLLLPPRESFKGEKILLIQIIINHSATNIFLKVSL